MLNNVLRRPVALGASMVLASAGALAMAPAASAASEEMTFTCQASLLGAQPFKTVADTDLPDQVEVGQEVEVGFTATVSVPDNVRGAAVFLYGSSVRGTAPVQTTIGAQAVPTTATFPLTQIPSSGELVLTVTGSGTWTPTAVGTQEVRLASYDANLEFPKADGTVQELAIPCAPAAGTNTLVDTVEVVDPAPTPDPEPTETPDPEPTETPDPEPTETPDPEPTETPDPEPTETQTPDPTPTTGPQPGANPLLALLGKAAKIIKTIACKIWKC